MNNFTIYTITKGGTTIVKRQAIEFCPNHYKLVDDTYIPTKNSFLSFDAAKNILHQEHVQRLAKANAGVYTAKKSITAVELLRENT